MIRFAQLQLQYRYHCQRAGLFVARELAPAGLRSRPKNIQTDFTTATQPSGSKLPRHNSTADDHCL
ncbi:hypothetical protein EIY72_21205 [Pseudomonas vancouverensis]|uniref:Uncharacterized protein n=1 Tax=Pseudomonas vancouverensis TaxID=95300 RepID=A0A4R4JYS5_PSEVA|nr:hypothetical protein F7R09_27620 [Pseudomonas vancouverensis]TDB58819.1 hypothetical protein EIY72_21205 [Pseudomonas vancouverensis]